MTFPYRNGRLAPDYRQSRLWLEDYQDASSLPVFKPLVDYCSQVSSWPMYLNDELGDCTFAGLGHAEGAWTKYTTGTELILPDAAMLDGYEAVGKYVPGNPGTDNGCVMSNVLAYAASTGLPSGTKILSYAQMKDTHELKLNVALQLFGSVYLGVNLPKSAEDQFSANQVWSYVKGSPIVGGHCIVLQKFENNSNGDYTVITWGQAQRVTLEWMRTYLEEAWVILSPQWLNAQGNTITGVNVQQLQADMALL